MICRDNLTQHSSFRKPLWRLIPKKSPLLFLPQSIICHGPLSGVAACALRIFAGFPNASRTVAKPEESCASKRPCTRTRSHLHHQVPSVRHADKHRASCESQDQRVNGPPSLFVEHTRLNKVELDPACPR